MRLVVAFVAVEFLATLAARGELDCQRVLCLVVVLYGMSVTASSIELLASTIQLAAAKAHPQVFLELARRAFVLAHSARTLWSDRVYVRALRSRVHVVLAARYFQIPARLVRRAIKYQSTGEQLVVIRLRDLRQRVVAEYYHFILVFA